MADLQKTIAERVNGSPPDPAHKEEEHHTLQQDLDMSTTRDSEEAKPDPSYRYVSAIGENAYLAANLINRYLRKVPECDGCESRDVLTWIEALDKAPAVIRPTLIEESVDGPLKRFILKNHTGNHDWDTERKAIIAEFVSSSYSRVQKEALQSAKQRPSESLLAYNHYFDKLLREAYPDGLPSDQEDLVSSYLSGLKNRGIAETIARKEPQTVEDAMAQVRKRMKGSHLLRPKEDLALTHAASPAPEQFEKPKWETGYQVLTNHQGGLRVERLRDGRILRLNQSDARPLPPAKPYEEVDPVDTTLQSLSGPNKATELPREAKALPQGTYALAPNQYPSVLEWNSWLEVIKEECSREGTNASISGKSP